MTQPGLGVALGLASALSFGGGDFAGGFAARRIGGLPAAAGSQLVGCLILAVVVVVGRPPIPDPGSLAIGFAAGLSGAVGVAALYRGLAEGAMGVVAAISGAGSVAIPLLVSLSLLHNPIGATQVVGAILAGFAVVAASGAARGRASREALGFALLAAAGFGLWYVLLDRAAIGEPTWALFSGRVGGTALLGALTLATGRLPSMRAAPGIITAAGIADVGGNALFVASRALLPVGLAAALSGIYPLVTLLFARWLLRERLPALGALGVGLALVAIVLIATGTPP